MRATGRGGTRHLVATAVLVLVLTGCSATPSAQHRAAATHHRDTATTVPPASSSVPRLNPHRPAMTTTVPAEPGWTPLSMLATGVAIDEQAVTTPGGARVILVRFRAGQVRFALHGGSLEPPTGGVTLGPDAQPQVGTAERAVLLAAFNGGFKVSGHAGGVEIDGHVLTPLVAGLASLVIDTGGAAHVGIWGVTAPAPGEPVVSVRQNLAPLVVGSQPSPSIGALFYWGDPLHERPVTARSALGQDAAGDLIFAASMGALPTDMASALLQAGAIIAMELDINPEWVQADVAASPGAPLMATVPGQNQSSNRYLLGWTRDFITVDAA